MARARLVKPEFFGDVVLSEVSRDARLLYIGLWQLMDRRGLMEYHPKLVKRDLFPYDDDFTTAVVEAMIAELTRVGRLRIINFSGKRYLHCPHLAKHQQFHHREKLNAHIPDEVLLQPEAGPGLAPDSPGAGPTEAEADTEAESEAEAEAVPNPVVGLGNLPLGEFLRDVTEDEQYSWIAAAGLELVREQLPFAKAKWDADPTRQTPYMQMLRGGKHRYVLNWLQKAVKDRASPGQRHQKPSDAGSIAEEIRQFEAGGS